MYTIILDPRKKVVASILKIPVPRKSAPLLAVKICQVTHRVGIARATNSLFVTTMVATNPRPSV